MAEINDLDIVDGSNIARFPEGLAAGQFNDNARALEGILARWHEDTGARKSSTGSANAYLFAAARTITAYYDGLVIGFDASFQNTGAATLNVDSLGAITIKKHHDQDLASGDIEVGQTVLVIYDGTNFQMISQLGVAVPSTGRLLSVQVFTSTGGNTWTKPAGINSVRVQLVGGGGGGARNQSGQAGAGGGGGGYSEEFIDVTGTSSETATVGAGGAGATSDNTDGADAGTSSFGAFCSATGGGGGKDTNTTGGVGGVGTGGDINSTGNGGGGGSNSNGESGTGGGSYFGGGGGGVGITTGNTNGRTGQSHGGGGGGSTGTDPGGTGADGVVIVWEYS